MGIGGRNGKIKVFLSNVKSLRNKMQELISLVVVHQFDIVGITESWTSEYFNKDFLSEYKLKGYKGHFYQREDRQGGGVTLYVRDKFTTKNIHGIKLDKCVESVWLDINTEKGVWLNMYSVERRYRRGDIIEVFKMFSGLDDLKVEDFFEVDTANRWGLWIYR